VKIGETSDNAVDKNTLNIVRFTVLALAMHLRYQESIDDMHWHDLSLCLWR